VLTGPGFIELRVGEAIWMTAARLIITALAGLSLLLANTSWDWRLFALAALLLSSVLIHFRLHGFAGTRRMRLYANGAITLLHHDRTEQHASLHNDAWVSRWVTVIGIERLDRGSTRRLIIAKSINDPENYRRLLKLLRLGACRA